MSNSKADIDDLDNLPDAVTPQAASRKKARTITKTDSDLVLQRYDDSFCGDSIWLHCDAHAIDTNGCFKPEFNAQGKIVANSSLNNKMMQDGVLLRLPGYCTGWVKIPKASPLWGTHRIRVLGQPMATYVADYTRPHLLVRSISDHSRSLSHLHAHWQGTNFADHITLDDADGKSLDGEAPDIQAFYIPNLEYRMILEVFQEGSMLPTAGTGIFTDVANQKAFFVQTNSMLFKEAVHKKFPGGAFAKIEVAKPGLGSSGRHSGGVAVPFGRADLRVQSEDRSRSAWSVKRGTRSRESLPVRGRSRTKH